MNNKGMQFTLMMIIGLIMVLVSGTFLYMLVAKTPDIVCDEDAENCRLAVLTAYRSDKLSSVLNFDITNSCKDTTYRFINEPPREVNKIILHEIEKCIYKFHEGKLQLEALNNKCIMCATFDFSNYKKKDEYRFSYSLGSVAQNLKTKCARPKVTLAEYAKDVNIPGNLDLTSSYMILMQDGNPFFGKAPDVVKKCRQLIS